jgi:hypothetical protein
MNPRLISWNVRGLNQGDKWLKIRNLLRQWKADIICLQETILGLIANNIVRSLGGACFSIGAIFLLVGLPVASC